MLLNLHKKSWMDGLTLRDYNDHCQMNEKTVQEMLELAKNYNKVEFHFVKFKVWDQHFKLPRSLLFQALEEEDKMTPEQLAIKNVGKQVFDFCLHLLLCMWDK